MPDIFLYGGEANPNDIELRDPTVLDVDTGAITGTGSVVFQVSALAATALETFASTGAETFKVAALAATGAEKFTATGSETFAVAALAGTGTVGAVSITGTGAIAFGVPGLSGGESAPAVLPLGGSVGGIGPPMGHIRIVREQPRRLPRPVEVPTPPRRLPALVAAEVDNQDAIVALYAAGAIDIEEFAALIAA